MEVTFWGAAETVTGSRFVVDTDRARVLVDCGLFQGLKRLRELNWQPFPVDPSSIDAVILTHAHIDHSGYLPALVRAGFRGQVWCTRGTARLAAILLPDAARLQEEDARFANRRRSSKHRPALPLFTEADAERSLTRLRPAPMGSEVAVAPGVVASFTPAGHILGAATVRLSDGARSVQFSGDLGRDDDWIMPPPATRPLADHIVVESTYGNRSHPDGDALQTLAQVVTSTARRRGIVLVPVFAVGRAQTVLHLLARLRQERRIPDLPIFLNSPMAIDATELFMASSGEHRLSPGDVTELCRGVELVRSVDASKALTASAGPMIVLSASGMLTGGRVLHHLLRVAPDRHSTIVLAGFQAAGTRGEALLNDARTVRVFGEDVPVRCRIVHLDSLSAHADADQLLHWLRTADADQGDGARPSGISVVHGEASAADALRRRISHELGWVAHVPGHGSSVTVCPSVPPSHPNPPPPVGTAPR